MALTALILAISMFIGAGTAAASDHGSSRTAADGLLIGKDETEDVLDELDKTIDRREQFNKAKERRIADLKTGLTGMEDPVRKFHIYNQLFEEYKIYQYDSAYFYARRLESLAKSLRGGVENNDFNAIASSALLCCFKSVGFFNEAVEIINGFNPSGVSDGVLASFYILCASTWQNLSSYVEGLPDLQEKYDSLKLEYYDLAIAYSEKDSFEYAWISLERELAGNYSDELAVFGRRNLLARFNISEHAQAEQYSILASALSAIGKQNESLYYRAISAICDIRSCTHETTSAKVLAECMYRQKDIARASKYIHQALYDAEFYNSRLRMVEIGTILPVIENSRYMWVNRQRTLLTAFGATILASLIVTIVLLGKIRRRNRRLSEVHRNLVKNSDMLKKTSEALSELNDKLKETNEIKDQYIIQSLYGNSAFVNEVEEQTKFAARKIMARQYDDALMMLHHLGIKEERERMYASFDYAFLKLFPNFMEEFNKLFPPAAHIHLDEDGHLPMEIRIFALMRLGIDNAAQIAEYLNLSVNTVYVYKTKLKSRSNVSKEDFDAMVMAIKKQ